MLGMYQFLVVEVYVSIRKKKLENTALGFGKEKILPSPKLLSTWLMPSKIIKK